MVNRINSTGFLLDTNIFLWWLNDDKKLKSAIRETMADPQNILYISVVSAWEISLKHKIGKLPLKTTLKRCFEISPFPILTLRLEHILNLDKLPLFHKDPFDRLLITQSKVENLTLITSDQQMRKYNISLLKA